LSYDVLLNAVAALFDAIGVPLNENTPKLLVNAVTDGIMRGGYFSAVTVGVSIAFGILDIVNIAHPAFIILGAYVAFFANDIHIGSVQFHIGNIQFHSSDIQLHIDPVLAGVIALPVFYGLGALLYQVYHLSFEKRGQASGQDASGQDSLRALAFFFGILFITEVGLALQFGVDLRNVSAPYLQETWHIGLVDLSMRKLVPFVVSLAMLAALQIYLTRTFMGRAIMAVAQDQFALRLMGADPVRVKRIAFAISIATASLAGTFLIIFQSSVEPSMGREYIGLVFAICVLGGMGSLTGTLIAAMLLGLVQSFTETFYGPSWAPAVSFGLLLLTLAFRPSGIMGR
jgi:branched-chain amino acid transport system permease protein